MQRAVSIIFICTVLSFAVNSQKTIEVPSDLLIGVASSAYQVEGAWNKDGKSENIWDRLTHKSFTWEENGDVACDSYHKIEEDVQIIKNTGSQFYRFSLSWTRILPSGFPNKINEAGINYYNKLIDQLLAKSIIPMVTIYHWDLPQALQDLGGFANPLIANWFEDYANVVYSKFGDRVKHWITINEPKQICNYGYGWGRFAPGYNSSGVGEYLCSKNLLLSHARMYRLYDEVYRTTQKGKVGFVNECAWNEPASNKTEDIEAAERRATFEFGLYTHPVFHKDGDYPQIIKDIIAKRSLAEGFKKSRLPELSLKEVDYIKGTSDFFGLNHYTTLIVSHKKPYPIGEPSLDKDLQVDAYQDDSWLTGSIDYFRLVPWGLRKVLNFIKTNYNNPEIYITENGFPDLGDMEDNNRITFFQKTLEAIIAAMKEDGVSVKSFTVWSLMDSYEWRYGYEHKFGLYSVDFNNINKTRTPRKSVQFFQELISTRKLKVD